MTDNSESKEAYKKYMKEKLKTHYINGNIQGLLNIKERLRNELGVSEGNEMYDKLLKKVRKEID